MSFFYKEYLWYHLLLSFMIGGYLYRPIQRILFRGIRIFFISLKNGFWALVDSEETSEEDTSNSDSHSSTSTENTTSRKTQPVRNKLNYLENRLNNLKTRITSGENLEECKREMEKCKALAENIKDLATFQKINFQEVFFDFQKIRELLVDMEYLIGKRENVWWRKIIHKIKVIFQLISIKLLPPGV
ncbi:MAG: hypothetical protein MI974_28180 [Chitinophagales bacterium]|nr:hypothetical protein [Chitinophagales bacterium]